MPSLQRGLKQLDAQLRRAATGAQDGGADAKVDERLLIERNHKELLRGKKDQKSGENYSIGRNVGQSSEREDRAPRVCAERRRRKEAAAAPRGERTRGAALSI